MTRESAAREEEIFPVPEAVVLEKPRVKKIKKPGARPRSSSSTEAPSITLSIAAPAQSSVAPSEAIELYQIGKRVFDFTGAAILLILTAPLMGIVALLVKHSSPGPVILRQTRLTAGGKTFSMYKFRSMRTDAESKCGPVMAQANDARVTPYRPLHSLNASG